MKLKRDSLMGQMSVALQEPLLWDDTVRNNIRYGYENATEEEVEACARVAGADLFIQRLPSGYDTVIGENACRLSEGQKQRIALARALIRRPRILILDEAISALDSESEAAVFSGIRHYCSGTTILYISHRLSMVMKADKVYYMKAPDVIVMDRPEALWAGDKNFAALFSDQKMA
jgi:ABC-type multidrug transport system fused ATPase/permease subunit